MAFTAADVKNLREMTGVGMMDCKKALTETDGDMDKAVEYLREKGLAKAAKKAGRIAAEGMAYATVCEKCGVGAMVEVNCETDFCAKSAPFVQFVKDICQVVLENNPADVEAIKAAGESLQSVAYELAQVVYADAQQQTDGAAGAQSADDDVVDADYEVVDDEDK